MWFTDTIFSLVWDISEAFYSAYTTTQDWVWPFSYLQFPLWGLYEATRSLLSPIANLGDWLYDVSAKIANVMSAEGVLGLIKYWFPWLESPEFWFSNWFASRPKVIADWWLVIEAGVRSWINTATQGLGAMISAWSNFVTVILPTLFDLEYAETWYRTKLASVGGLIQSAFVERSDLWQGWSDFRQSVIDFITAPFDWLIDRFADWFLGGE